MKKTIYILSVLLGMVTVTEAQTAIDLRKQDIVDGVSVENLKIERNGGYIAIDMLWDLSGLDVDDNRAVLLTPVSYTHLQRWRRSGWRWCHPGTCVPLSRTLQ